MILQTHTQEDERAISAHSSVSIVIPICNEAGNIEPLSRGIAEVMRERECKWEVIFVDDGSTDGSADVLARMHAELDAVSVLILCRNFGQTAAMEAGIRAADGDVIITMDGDQQNDPADIPRLLAKLEDGYDLVTGWRVDRKDPYLSRILPSKAANLLISVATGTHLHDYGCTLKAMRSEVAKRLPLYGEMHRFVPALAASMGARIAELPVNHKPRTEGRAKYGIGRTLRVVLDLLTVKFLSGYAARPAHVFGLIGLLSFAAGLAVTSALGVGRLFLGAGLADRPLLLLGILLLITGLQFLSMGLLAEILSRIYHEDGRNSPYIIRHALASRNSESLRGEPQAVSAGPGPMFANSSREAVEFNQRLGGRIR